MDYTDTLRITAPVRHPGEPAARLERISGPLRGLWLASYAVEADGRFLGYAKLCPQPPADVWECHAVHKLAGRGRPTPDAAVEDVEDVARWFIESQASLDVLLV